MADAFDLTEDEANAAFDELIEILRSSDLHWIADQVSREIAEGKSVIAEITPHKARARAAEFTRVVPYDAQSRLLKLITAIEETILSSVSIAEHLLEFAPSSHFRISFKGDLASGSGSHLSKDDLVARAPARDRLRDLLSELRGGINFADSTRPAR